MPETYAQQVDALTIKLDAQVSDETATKMLIVVAAHVQSVIDKYPSSSSANSPPGNNNYSWYFRGFGTRTRTGKAYATSENFGHRWTQKRVTARKRLLENNTSYGGYLIGEKQVAWAKRVGWVLAKKRIQEESAEIRRLAAKVIEKVNKS